MRAEDWENLIKLIERAGRTCYKSEDKITMTIESSETFIHRILHRGHESVIEHGSISVRFICDRGVSHELVRHRLASFSQESTRYVNYGDGNLQFIIPPWISILQGVWEINSRGFYLRNGETVDISSKDQIWIDAMINAAKAYQESLDCGMTPQEARAVLPNSTKTELVMTANPREWRHIFKLRTSPAAHPQMREVMVPLLEDFIAHFPVLFEGIWQNEIHS
jgi:thymidylate synthase (FAD)